MDQAIIYNSIKTSDRIYFLKENSIFEYNHTAKSLKNHDFELKIIDLLTCVHPTTDNILFCLGISKETKIGISFIYDLSLNLIQNYVHTAPSYIFSCEIFDSEIYTFGGLLENSPKQAKKYSIAKNRWISLQNLPRPSDYCNCIEFNHRLIVTGRSHRWIYIYDPYIDSYSFVPGLHRSHKILIKGNNCVYIFETEGGIFESEIGDPYHWSIISSDRILSNSYTNAINYENSAVFIVNEELTFEFDLTTKYLKKPKHI